MKTYRITFKDGTYWDIQADMVKQLPKKTVFYQGNAKTPVATVSNSPDITVGEISSNQ